MVWIADVEQARTLGIEGDRDQAVAAVGEPVRRVAAAAAGLVLGGPGIETPQVVVLAGGGPGLARVGAAQVVRHESTRGLAVSDGHLLGGGDEVPATSIDREVQVARAVVHDPALTGQLALVDIAAAVRDWIAGGRGFDLTAGRVPMRALRPVAAEGAGAGLPGPAHGVDIRDVVVVGEAVVVAEVAEVWAVDGVLGVGDVDSPDWSPTPGGVRAGRDLHSGRRRARGPQGLAVVGAGGAAA